ncbi:hypothetical protein Scep_022247 [Stephania cephalantha]|uniref:Uncharacterized protein n=1 Tax=Stephania cephalantha TaxID=152367 RepID=A0AAP0HXK7_9MAGN
MLSERCKIDLREMSSLVILSDGNRGGSGGGDFVVGFLLGGAVFGTLAYIFAPQAQLLFSKQIRISILNEDEYGFRKAKRPIYYDEGLDVIASFLTLMNSFVIAHPQGVVGGGAGDGVGLMVVFSGLEVMENQLD